MLLTVGEPKAYYLIRQVSPTCRDHGAFGRSVQPRSCQPARPTEISKEMYTPYSTKFSGHCLPENQAGGADRVLLRFGLRAEIVEGAHLGWVLKAQRASFASFANYHRREGS